MSKFKILNNIFLIILSIFLSFGLVYLFKNTELLQASILSLEDYTTIKKNNWDMAYKTQNNHLEIFCSDTLDLQVDTITTHIIHNDDIIIDWGKAEYQNSMHINTQTPGETKIIINNIKTINCKESIIDVPFDGEYRNLIVNTIISTNKKKTKNLKIGNLNTTTTHG
ncbi:MAG: hypothetical protein CR971_01810 [candidate division SR1 bacterium]|nr:MAG: hypothetical protein CR971_01810 [candidate division SR1 bacterium]